MRNLSWSIPLACVLILVVLWTTQQAFLNQDQLKRELGVLKASYIQMAALVGAGEQKVEKEKSCREHTQIAFAKTHKTGSSTLQNILFRFGDLRNLTFAIPEKSWMYSFQESFHHSMISNLPWASLGYNIFAFHSVWNYNEVRKLLPSATFVTLLRDPVDCWESNYVYMGLQNAFKMDINEFAASEKARPEMTRRENAIIGKNQQLWDLGLSRSDMENEANVDAKIAELSAQFDFVILAEFFDEGLVILARLLCWELEDVRYLKQNARTASKVNNITLESREALTRWLSDDFKLYNHFERKFKEAVESYGKEELEADVARLQELNNQLRDDCVLDVGDNSKLSGEFKMAMNIVEGYVVNPEKGWCTPFALGEPKYSTKVRQKQRERAKSAVVATNNTESKTS